MPSFLTLTYYKISQIDCVIQIAKEILQFCYSTGIPISRLVTPVKNQHDMLKNPPCSIGNTFYHLHSWWIFQLVMLVFGGGYRSKLYTPWKINGWNIHKSPIWKGNGSEPNLHEDMFQPLIFRGVSSQLLPVGDRFDFNYWPQNPP